MTEDPDLEHHETYPEVSDVAVLLRDERTLEVRTLEVECLDREYFTSLPHYVSHDSHIFWRGGYNPKYQISYYFEGENP